MQTSFWRPDQWHFFVYIEETERNVQDPKSHQAKSSLTFSLRSLQSIVRVVTRFVVDNVINEVSS